MRRHGWRSKYKKKFKITTAVAAYIKTDKGWPYLTTVIDLYDRQVIGHRGNGRALSTGLFTGQTIIPAWEMAVSKRKITGPLLFHRPAVEKETVYQDDLELKTT